MIAVKLGAFQLSDDSVVLHPVIVLDVIEETEEGGIDGGGIETVDRAFWEKNAALASLAIMDQIIALLKAGGLEPRLTYNRYHIAMGTTGYNFCWFQPRKTAGHCYIEFRVDGESRETIISSLQTIGIDASPRRAHNIVFNITAKGLTDYSATNQLPSSRR